MKVSIETFASKECGDSTKRQRLFNVRLPHCVWMHLYFA